MKFNTMGGLSVDVPCYLILHYRIVHILSIKTVNAYVVSNLEHQDMN